jgi:hypothetical protein
MPADNCSSGRTNLQIADAYEAPADGVITSWSFQAPANTVDIPTLKFKVARPLPNSSYTIIGESPPTAAGAGVLGAFPVQIPAKAGDVIGFSVIGSGMCATVAGGPSLAVFAGDLAPGSTGTPAFVGNAQLDVSAQLEPDVDGDGFGDETQDQCAASASAQSPCPVPETKITGGPRKTDKTKARFAFTSSVPDSTFECRLKGPGLKPAVKRFGPCASPRTYKGLEDGKYRFGVRATSPAGLVDSTPARRKLKVVE